MLLGAATALRGALHAERRVDGGFHFVTGPARHGADPSSSHLPLTPDPHKAPYNDDEPPRGRLEVLKEPAATYSPGPVKAKYHRRCGA